MVSVFSKIDVGKITVSVSLETNDASQTLPAKYQPAVMLMYS
jgi:hypothetical protein